ncbi:ATP-binding protein [Mesoflavibacter profundi]|uniref:histidine kinase n=1 Tax=Mesoflavibacter profundi TaxID=2708110 RepID=A0ABT4S0N2_9FLAO|nr:tetratricopeptide repeat-containing sensor histidine kinase [Mesoflavibacter profundi]MDA0177630.1 ATP-binding protein [Mesoflavibacter profundi]
MRYFILISFFLHSITLVAQNDQELIDSVVKLRKASKNSQIELKDRFNYARKAIALSKEIGLDSTILESNRTLSYLFLVEENYDSLYRVNSENLKLASKLQDSIKMAYASHNLAFHYYNNNKNDSSYYYFYNARKIYSNLKDRVNEVSTILSMANIQESERDFIGAENNAINGIKILEALPSSDNKNYSLWALNNLVGIVNSQIQQFDRSIEYHDKALSYANKIKDPDYQNLQDYSTMNIALAYRRKKEYSKAISILQSIKNIDQLKQSDPSSYASIISNIAYSKFLLGETTTQIENTLKEAYQTAADENDDMEQSSICAFLSEFYLSKKQSDSAKKFADLAYKFAIKADENQDILNALILKSKTETGASSKDYLYKHIKFNDSLVLNERVARNKFARIEFETDAILQEKEQITKQRQWLIFISIGLLATLFFLYVIKSQREKNKELQLEKQQQQANEEIYGLMLSQQDKIDEARTIEKNRISQEIHDGILGRLFGARLSLDSLNNLNTEEATLKRSNYIHELKNIEEDIRKVSHELNTDFVKSGYLDMIKSLVDAQMMAYGIAYTFNADSNINWDNLDNKIKIHLYRILQETMQNTYKHAKASKVDITFSLEKNTLNLSIVDNGVGFDTNKSKKGIGLKNISDRLKEIKGKLDIQTQLQQGTTIHIYVPNV